MWKPVLFLITVVLVTPIGRAALGRYTHHALSMFAVGSIYADLAIAALALALLGLILLILCQSPKDPNAKWILRRVQGQEPAEVPSRRAR